MYITPANPAILGGGWAGAGYSQSQGEKNTQQIATWHNCKLDGMWIDFVLGEGASRQLTWYSESKSKQVLFICNHV